MQHHDVRFLRMQTASKACNNGDDQYASSYRSGRSHVDVQDWLSYSIITWERTGIWLGFNTARLVRLAAFKPWQRYPLSTLFKHKYAFFVYRMPLYSLISTYLIMN